MIKHMTWDNIQYFEKAFLVCYDIIVLKRGFQLIRCVRLTHIMTGALALKLHHEKSAEILHAMKSREVSGERHSSLQKKVHCFFDFVKIIFSSSFRRNLFQEEFLEFLARREFFCGIYMTWVIFRLTCTQETPWFITDNLQGSSSSLKFLIMMCWKITRILKHKDEQDIIFQSRSPKALAQKASLPVGLLVVLPSRLYLRFLQSKPNILKSECRVPQSEE